ncbi:MAG: sulfatase-like hydrolase/transferase [Actinomycetota bacterium]|nr:sulfatase-like hydrolase/transferase [Actinomycetota bacterium]
MTGDRKSFAARIGARRNTNPRDIAAWLIAPFILVVLIPANEKISSNAVFFAAHSVTPITWVVVLTIFLISFWLLLIALFALIRRGVKPPTFDVIASVMMFVSTWFLAGNLVSRLLNSSASILGPVIGLVIAALLTQLSRRMMMGTVLVIFAAIAAVFPVVMSLTVGSDVSAAELKFTATESRPNIVWVISDELQYPLAFDEQGEVRGELPNLAKLQETATTYTHAYAAANYTDYAVPSLLTGISDVAAAGVDRMAKVRSGIGIVPSLAAEYSVVMQSPIYQFECDTTACASTGSDQDLNIVIRYLNFAKDAAAVAGRSALAPPFSTVFPSLDGKWRDFWSGGDEFGDNAEGNSVQKVIAGIDRTHATDTSNPIFVLWHTIRTHAPWSVDREGKEIYPARLPVVEGAHMVGSDKDGLYSSPELQSMERRLYANSAVDFDRQMGELLEALTAAGLFDNTMIIVTADHGAGITVARDRRMGDTDQQRWTEVAHVPLLIKEPGQVTAKTVSRPRSTGQIAQSVVDTALAVTAPELTLSPGLGQDLPTGPVFTTIAYGGVLTPWVYSAGPEPSPWLAEDLTPPDPRHPFAIGVDLELLGEQVPAGWTEVAGATIDALPGESEQQLLVVDRPTNSCPATSPVGLISARGMVIGSVLWEQGRQVSGPRTRGWAIVPRKNDYAVWCAN